MKILINALSGIGDALMFSPALKQLKQNLPDSSIDMLVMFKSVKEMYEHNPFLDKIYFINFLGQSKFNSFAEIRKLKQNEYDVSINVYPANRFEYNFLNSMLGAKKKIAHHYLHTNLFRAEYFNDILINEVRDRHNVLQNTDLIKNITNSESSSDSEDSGKMEIYISEKHKQKALEWINEINPGKKLLAGFHAGSALLKNHINKRWDKNKFAETGKILVRDYNAKILLFGNELELNAEIRNMIGEEALIASTPDFMDSVARMKHCNLFISNDTAFLHCAAALNIPTVAIFGYTNYKELYPWKSPHVIVRKQLDCSPCFYNSPKPATCIFNEPDNFKCMKTIEVNEVLKAVEELKKYFFNL